MDNNNNQQLNDDALLKLTRKVERGNPKECVEKLFAEVLECIEECQASELQARQTLESYSKEEEIARLQRVIEEMHQAMNRSVYILTDAEKKKDKEFSELHYRKCRANTYYEVFSTGVGQTCKKVCPQCGAKEDLTDYSMW